MSISDEEIRFLMISSDPSWDGLLLSMSALLSEVLSPRINPELSRNTYKEHYYASVVSSNVLTNMQAYSILKTIASKAVKIRLCALNFRTYPVFKYTKSHTSTNLPTFLKLCLSYCQRLFVCNPTNR